VTHKTTNIHCCCVAGSTRLNNWAMCIALFLWQCHPLYPFLLLNNRDEYHNRQAFFLLLFFFLFFSLSKFLAPDDLWNIHARTQLLLGWRPTKPACWWEDCDILGGRDEIAMGTWLACSTQGRVAFLTNVLELHTLPEAKSRGDLPVLFLKVSSESTFSLWLVCRRYFTSFFFLLCIHKLNNGRAASNRKNLQKAWSQRLIITTDST